MKRLKNLLAEGLNFLQPSELRELLQAIEGVLAIQRLGGRVKNYDDSVAVSMAIEALRAGLTELSPYKLEDRRKMLLPDLDCLIACEWEHLEGKMYLGYPGYPLDDRNEEEREAA